MNDPERHPDATQLVTFHLGSEIYGVEISRIREVIHYREPAAASGAPESIDGVIELRGRRIPVMDLMSRIGQRSTGREARRIVILELEERPLGIVVDDIHQVLRISRSQYEALPESLSGDRRSSCIQRLAITEDALIMVLEPERILTRAQLRELIQFEMESEEVAFEHETDSRSGT